MCIPLGFSEREDVLIELYGISCLLFKKFSSDNIIPVLLSLEIHIPIIFTCRRNSSESGWYILKINCEQGIYRSRLKEVILSLFSQFMRSPGVLHPALSPQHKEEMDLLEKVQRGDTELVRHLKHLS